LEAAMQSQKPADRFNSQLHSMRIGELGNIRVADCEINSPIPGVRIVRNPDDPIDPRKIKPTPKTAGRLLPVESSLARAVDDSIEKERFRIPNSHKTPFLFLNVTNGQPLSLRQFDRIFEQISRRHPGRFKSMFPHILRHTVLTRIMDGLKARGFDEKIIVQRLKDMAGWVTDNSGTYTAASIERECHFQMREHQRRLYSRNEDKVEYRWWHHNRNQKGQHQSTRVFSCMPFHGAWPAS